MPIERFNFIEDYTNLNNKVEFVSVTSPDLEILFRNIKHIEKQVRTLNSVELEELFTTLKRLRSIVFSTLDNFSDKLNSYFNDREWHDLRDFFNRLVELDDSLKNLSQETYTIINNLKNNFYGNPLNKKISDLIHQNETKSIAVCAKYLDSSFSVTHSNIEYLKPHELAKGYKVYDVVIFIGTPYIYKGFNTIFIGEEIYYVAYNVYKNYLSKMNYIQGNNIDSIELYKKVELSDSNQKTKNTFFETDLTDIEKNKINKWIMNHNQKHLSVNNAETGEEVVTGKIIQLENNKHIVMSPHSKFRVVDERKDKDNKLVLTLISKYLDTLKVGEWIIIKQSTEEDYLVKKSKDIFGEAVYNERVDLVNEYKNDLKSRMSKFRNIDKFIEDLKNNNVNVSTVQVLKNWLGETIRPRNLEKILLYLGYSQLKINETINAADFINKAHNTAGRELVKNIEVYLKLINVEELEAAMALEKEYEFNVDSIGLFSIQLVKSIIKENISIHPKNMYKITETSEGI